MSHISKKEEPNQIHTHLSIKASCHSDDVTGLVVNGKHIGGGALRILRQDFVSQHPISSFWVILINCCHSHHEGACREHKMNISSEISHNALRKVTMRACVCVTRLGSLRYWTIEYGVCELWSVVILVDDINDDVDRVLHLVPIQVNSVSSQLPNEQQYFNVCP